MTRLIWIAFLMLLSLPVWAQDLEQAAMKTVEQLEPLKTRLSNDQFLVIDVTNYFSNEKDSLTNLFETELYLALEKVMPGTKLVLAKSSRVGIPLSKTIFLKGRLRQKGSEVVVFFQAVGGIDGEVLAQTESRFVFKDIKKKTLMAVLDLQADGLTPVQIKAFSEIFRSQLSDLGLFALVSSAEINRLNPDKIQESTGCSRDECAVIIGEQLGVDRSLSTQIFKLSESHYILSAKVLDIKDAMMIQSKTVEHRAGIDELKGALRQLAFKLGETQQPLVSLPKLPPAISPGEEFQPRDLTYHYVASSTAGIAGYIALLLTISYNGYVRDNERLLEYYRNSTDAAKQRNYKISYEHNQERMKEIRNQIKTFDQLFYAGVIWETYLLITMEKQEAVTKRTPDFDFAVSTNKAAFRLKWRF
ncbi:MAG: hypothetical protein OEY59_13905 [Deltaproteobacteria bacterium]|nr:hypothetical protein [Deltaproteobacteria bacterium]